MIEKDELIALILEACPSFQEKWNNSDDKELLYVVMGDLADHLLTLYRAGKTEDFTPLGKVIERLHTDGDNYVKELATIGLLEGIQNVWGNNGADPEEFYRYLLPESQKWWKELNSFWSREEEHNQKNTPDQKPVR